MISAAVSSVSVNAAVGPVLATTPVSMFAALIVVPAVDITDAGATPGARIGTKTSVNTPPAFCTERHWNDGTSALGDGSCETLTDPLIRIDPT